MTIEETRLNLAVRLADRAMRTATAATLEDRLDAFDVVYRAMLPLASGDDDWSAETLAAACSIVEDAYPHGGEPASVARALASAHARVSAVAEAAPAARRSKPRRDA